MEEAATLGLLGSRFTSDITECNAMAFAVVVFLVHRDTIFETAKGSLRRRRRIVVGIVLWDSSWSDD